MGRIDFLKVREICQPGRKPIDVAIAYDQSPEALESPNLLRDLGKALIKQMRGQIE
jgi:hypothetical protein